jgi:hypothetical protein
MAELLRQMHEMVGGGEPPEIATSYLAIPQDSVLRFQGSAVPILSTSMTQRPDGLILPTQTLGDRVLAMGRRYMTSLELMGRPIPPEVARVLIGGHEPENILTASAVLMAQLYETGDPTDPLVQRHLVESYLAGDLRRRAEGLLAESTWVFLAAQPVLGVINVALMVGTAIVTQTADQAPRDAVIAALGLAAVLGGGPPDDEVDETLFGGIPRSTVVDLLANQVFNRSINLGTELARWQRTRECGAAAYPNPTAIYDQVFFEATGTTPDVLFDVGFTALLKQNEIHTVVISPTLFGQLHHPPDQIDAAIQLLATDVETLGAEVKAEVDAVGFEWAFTALRRFPMLRKENGDLLILNPGFLIERICGSAFHWEVMQELNQRERSGGAAQKVAKRLRGGFGGFTGHVAEEYIADRLSGIAGHNDGLAKVLWREGELQPLWPGESCCDILIDGGTSWIPMEIVRLGMTVSFGPTVMAWSGPTPLDMTGLLRAGSTGGGAQALLSRRWPVALSSFVGGWWGSAR